MGDLASDIIRAIQRGRFDLSNEKACQAEMFDWLADAFPGLAVLREYPIGSGTIADFLIETVAIEVKMNRADAPATVRQLKRYAESSLVETILLVTNRAMSIPAQISGKPVQVISLGSAWL